MSVVARQSTSPRSVPEIDLASRTVAGDMGYFEIKNLGGQAAEHIADASSSSFTEPRQSSRARMPSMLVCGVSLRQAIIMGARLKLPIQLSLAEVKLDFRPAHHLLQIIRAMDSQNCHRAWRY